MKTKNTKKFPYITFEFCRKIGTHFGTLWISNSTGKTIFELEELRRTLLKSICIFLGSMQDLIKVMS
jgi:hypothetical protein